MSTGRQGPHATRELVNVLITGEQTQERLALVEMVVRPTEEPPLHAHTLEDEVIYVLRGEITVQLDGHNHRCTAGDCVLLPKGSEHTYSVESEEATLLLLLMPAGLESYYQEIGGPAETERHIEQLIAASARYGVEIVGPGPSATRSRGAVPMLDRGREEMAR